MRFRLSQITIKLFSPLTICLILAFPQAVLSNETFDVSVGKFHIHGGSDEAQNRAVCSVETSQDGANLKFYHVMPDNWGNLELTIDDGFFDNIFSNNERSFLRDINDETIIRIETEDPSLDGNVKAMISRVNAKIQIEFARGQPSTLSMPFLNLRKDYEHERRIFVSFLMRKLIKLSTYDHSKGRLVEFALFDMTKGETALNHLKSCITKYRQ